MSREVVQEIRVRKAIVALTDVAYAMCQYRHGVGPLSLGAVSRIVRECVPLLELIYDSEAEAAEDAAIAEIAKRYNLVK